jgi:hypothetical protein
MSANLTGTITKRKSERISLNRESERELYLITVSPGETRLYELLFIVSHVDAFLNRQNVSTEAFFGCTREQNNSRKNSMLFQK